MPITQRPARQQPMVAHTDFTFTSLVSGAYEAAINLPLNAIVTRGELFITTIFNSVTTDQFSIGDRVGSAVAVVNTYAAITADVTVPGRAAVVLPTGIPTTAATSVGVVWTGVGTAPTAGAGRLVIEYVIVDKEDSIFEN